MSLECPKCKGLMMVERFSDTFLIFYAWKCLNCHAIIDRTVSTKLGDRVQVIRHGKPESC